jgi:triacylglycerol esterase/lipase EstA (alpha/beta hydrolase family)
MEGHPGSTLTRPCHLPESETGSDRLIELESKQGEFVVRMRSAGLVVVATLLASLLAPAAAGALRGVNDWSCRPGPAHPKPVVLVHGTGDNKDYTWRTLGPQLSARGYCAFSLTYGVLPNAPVVGAVVGGLTPIESSALELKSFVDKVLLATGADKVDIVGYSQGTMVPTYYAKFLNGRSNIDTYVSLAPLWDGTNPLGIGSIFMLLRLLGFGAALGSIGDCIACPEMLTGSDFLAKIRDGGIFLPEIAYTNIVTTHDNVVWPYTSGLGEGPNVTNVVLQDTCPTDEVDHVGLVVDPNALGHVFNALDPAHAKPVPCVPMGAR